MARPAFRGLTDRIRRWTTQADATEDRRRPRECGDHVVSKE
ncbi:hypothetical protein [Streptomyces sp. NPDC002044]